MTLSAIEHNGKFYRIRNGVITVTVIVKVEIYIIRGSHPAGARARRAHRVKTELPTGLWRDKTRRYCVSRSVITRFHFVTTACSYLLPAHADDGAASENAGRWPFGSGAAPKGKSDVILSKYATRTPRVDSLVRSVGFVFSPFRWRAPDKCLSAVRYAAIAVPRGINAP